MRKRRGLTQRVVIRQLRRNEEKCLEGDRRDKLALGKNEGPRYVERYDLVLMVYG